MEKGSIFTTINMLSGEHMNLCFVFCCFLLAIQHRPVYVVVAYIVNMRRQCKYVVLIGLMVPPAGFEPADEQMVLF